MSTVVLSNLPMGCIESDIHRALLMYGTAVHIEMNPHVAQAVVTMRTKQEAQALLNRRSVNVIGTSVRVDAQMAQPQQPTQPAHQPLYSGAAPAQQFHPHQHSQQIPQQQSPPQQTYAQQPPQTYAQPPPQTYAQQPPQTYAQQPQQTYAQQPQQTYAQQPPPSLPIQHPASHSQAPSTSAPGAHHHGGGGSGHSIMPTPPQTSPRLRVIVEDCRYPITRDVLTQMFSMIAPPVSVSCGPYGPTTTGAVEYADAAAAQQAVDQFHNNAIYPNCCYVKLYFEPMWDRPDHAQRPPSTLLHQQSSFGNGGSNGDASGGGGYRAPEPAGAHAYRAPSSAPPAQLDTFGANWGSDGDATRRYAPGVITPNSTPQPPPHPPQERITGDPYHHDRRSVALAMADLGLECDPAAQPDAEGDSSRVAAPAVAARGGRGAVRGGFSGRGGAPALGAAAAFSPYEPSSDSASARGGFGGVVRQPPGSAGVAGCAVMVSCVGESVPLYDLWVLLEVFGNVMSLRRQYHERTNVIAQFQHPGDTLTAVQYLQHCPFRGSALKLRRFSGYREWDKEWDNASAHDPATMAALFTTGYHHRTIPRAPVNVRGRVHPDKNLYIANLVEAISDDELKGVMRECGFEPDSFFRRGPNGAIVGYKDTETAVDALIAVHAKEIRQRFLRVTFSRFPPGPRPAQVGVARGNDGEDDNDSGEAEQPPQARPADSGSAEPPKPASST